MPRQLKPGVKAKAKEVEKRVLVEVAKKIPALPEKPVVYEGPPVYPYIPLAAAGWGRMKPGKKPPHITRADPYGYPYEITRPRPTKPAVRPHPTKPGWFVGPGAVKPRPVTRPMVTVPEGVKYKKVCRRVPIRAGIIRRTLQHFDVTLD